MNPIPNESPVPAPTVWYIAAGYKLPAGIEAYLLHYATELRDQGFDPRIIVFEPLPKVPHRFLVALRERKIPIESLYERVSRMANVACMASYLPWLVRATVRKLSSCSVAPLLSERPASPGELSSCSVAQLLSKGPEVSLPSSTQQPDNSTTPLSGPATQQPNNSTTHKLPPPSTTGHEVTLFSGAPLPASRLPLHTPIPRHSDTPTLSIHVLPCLKRGDRTTQQLSNWAPAFAWRWGLKNPYGWEQLSFWLRLWPHLRRGRYDILHVQDPMVAYWCRLFRKWGLVRTKEILAHGTEETAAFLAKFDYVQHLAPWHLEARGGKREAVSGNQYPSPESSPPRGEEGRESPSPLRGEGWGEGARKCEGESGKREAARGNQQPCRKWVVIPNFVDCEVFCPAGSGSGGVSECGGVGVSGMRSKIRERMGIPSDAFVIGCVAAVKKDHKRVDYLIGEIGLLVSRYSLSVIGNANNHEQITDNRAVSAPNNQQPRTNNRASGAPFLLIAGARTDETAELLALAESLIPGRYKILTDCPRDQMPDLYRAMDVFVLPSLFEMMPIALLEALASGLPCVVNHHPVLEWMIGAEGADQLLSCQVAELSGKKELSSCSVAQLLSESPASPGELSSCSVAQLLSKGPEVSLPSSTQQPDNSTTLLSGPATQQPSNSTTLRASGATQQPNNSTTVPASGGIAIDMGREGALAEALAGLTPDWLELHGRQARERALTMFSKEAVIRQYVGYYEDVMR